MVIVQDLDKNIIGHFTTISGFLKSAEMKERGARIGSYDYVRKRLAEVHPLVAIKYKSFYLSKSEPLKGAKKITKDDIFIF